MDQINGIESCRVCIKLPGKRERERERERERGNIEMTNNEEFADDSKGQSLLIASALY